MGQVATNNTIALTFHRNPEQKRTFDKEREWILAQPEVESILEEGWYSPSAISLNPIFGQTRTTTINQTHKTRLKNAMEENGCWPDDMRPISMTPCPRTGKPHGLNNHRPTAAKEASLEGIPGFIIKFKSAEEMDDPTLKPIKEYMQADNARNKPALEASEDDGLKMLEDKAADGHFNEAYKIVDVEEKHDKIREMAHVRLARRYSHLTVYSRAGIITRFLNGQTASLIKTWESKAAQAWFVDNNHLKDLNKYDALKNQVDICTQAHTALTYAVGQVERLLRDEWHKMTSDGISNKILKRKQDTLRIRLGLYTNAAKTHEALCEKRDTVIDEMTSRNLDPHWSPQWIVTELKFIYQSLRAPHKESERPIVYEWDTNTKSYVLQP